MAVKQNTAVEPDETSIPEYIFIQLDKYDRTNIERKLVMKLTKEKLLAMMKERGYNCKLNIQYGYKDPIEKIEYPKNATYILELIR